MTIQQMNKEIWKDIKGFEGRYQISNCGRVKSLIKHNGTNERILKGGFDKDGYHLVSLVYKDGNKITAKVHRLVAQAFLDNPENLPCVNHKDLDKLNNCVTNLEFCSFSYNNTYGDRISKVQNKTSIPIYGINLTNGLIIEAKSMSDMVRKSNYHFNVGGISDSVRKGKISKGYKFYLQGGNNA